MSEIGLTLDDITQWIQAGCKAIENAYPVKTAITWDGSCGVQFVTIEFEPLNEP